MQEDRAVDWNHNLALFLRLIRHHPSFASRRRTTVQLRDVDWTRLVQLALHHRLAPLLFEALNNAHASAVPADIHAAFATYVQGTRAHNTQLICALNDIVIALVDRGLAVMPIKGPVLGELAFADARLRISRDLDILVRESDVAAVMETLFELGYQLPQDTTPAGYRAIRRYGGQYILFGHANGIALEPHWSLTPSTLACDLDYTALWARATPISWDGRPILSPAPEDYLLILCVHGGKEHWPSLKPIVDLAYFIANHPTIDWDAALDQARRQGCLRMVRVGLELVSQCRLASLPPTLARQLGTDPTARLLATEVLTRIAQDRAIAPDIYALSSFHYRQRERLTDRLRYVWRTVMTPRAVHYNALPLPPRLHWLYPGVKVGHDYLAAPLWQLGKACMRAVARPAHELREAIAGTRGDAAIPLDRGADGTANRTVP